MFAYVNCVVAARNWIWNGYHISDCVFADVNCILLSGIGYGMVIISAIVCIYYNMIIAWTLHYFFNSFMAVLPWSTCNNEWNTVHCLDAQRRADLNMTNATLSTSALFNSSFKWRTPSEEYWEYVLLSAISNITEAVVLYFLPVVSFFRMYQ